MAFSYVIKMDHPTDKKASTTTPPGGLDDDFVMALWHKLEKQAAKDVARVKKI